MTIRIVARRLRLWSLALIAGSLAVAGSALPAHAATGPAGFTELAESWEAGTTIRLWLNNTNGDVYGSVSDPAAVPASASASSSASVGLVDAKTHTALEFASGNGQAGVNTNEVHTDDPVAACGAGHAGATFCTPDVSP